MKIWLKKNTLPILVFTAIAFDFAMTALGQPPGYWAGDSLPMEGNSIWRHIMQIHPLASVVADIAYLSALVFLIRKMTGGFRLVAGSLLVFAHGTAGFMWFVGAIDDDAAILRIVLADFGWAYYPFKLLVLPVVFGLTAALWIRSNKRLLTNQAVL